MQNKYNTNKTNVKPETTRKQMSIQHKYKFNAKSMQHKYNINAETINDQYKIDTNKQKTQYKLNTTKTRENQYKTIEH